MLISLFRLGLAGAYAYVTIKDFNRVESVLKTIEEDVDELVKEVEAYVNNR